MLLFSICKDCIFLLQSDGTGYYYGESDSESSDEESCRNIQGMEAKKGATRNRKSTKQLIDTGDIVNAMLKKAGTSKFFKNYIKLLVNVQEIKRLHFSALKSQCCFLGLQKENQMGIRRLLTGSHL